jgi:tetratricopeptide (TPR) repeat protein
MPNSTPHSLTIPQAIELAIQHHQDGRLTEAEVLYRSILGSEPNHPVANNLLGFIAFQTGHPDDAIRQISKSISAQPAYTDAYINMAIVLDSVGRTEEALTCCKKTIALDPNSVQGHFNLGTLQSSLGNYGKAIEALQKCISLNPHHIDARNNLGLAFHKNTLLDKAVETFEAALEIDPGNTDVLTNLGTSYADLGQLESAINVLQKGLLSAPSNLGLITNLAAFLRMDGRLEEGIALCRKTIAIDATYVNAHGNLGALLNDAGRHDEAIASYLEALRLNPDFATAHTNLARIYLTLGDFDKGWREFEWRWQDPNFPKRDTRFPQPLWLGEEDLNGKRILLHWEQGLGDTLQFCRYVRSVKALGATVILDVQFPLKELLSNLEGLDQIITEGDQVAEFDYHCPLMSLPLAFLNKGDPANTPYIAPASALVEEWSDRLSATRPKIGIAWSGSRIHKKDHIRSIPLKQFGTLFSRSDIEFHVLQKDITADEQLLLNSKHNVFSHDTEFSGTAARTSLMDLVITVDTSIAHLAGSLGQQTWLLLDSAPDFRWLLEGEENRWYPNTRLFRQQKTGDWEGVLSRISTSLEETYPRPV